MTRHAEDRRDSPASNYHAVLGYGGNGITFSMLAATLLTKAILGRRDPDASLFEFG
jgi:glycine/D-amino acid oxidase-like deaminating enzyme